jgi:hypothetical protein
MTDIDGAFVINNVALGDYYAQARLAGYLAPTDLVASEFESGHLAFLKAVDAALPRLSVDESFGTPQIC